MSGGRHAEDIVQLGTTAVRIGRAGIGVLDAPQERVVGLPNCPLVITRARAVTVLRYLNERKGIEGSRLSAVAFGHEKPLIDPSHPQSQMLNKRVDVVVVSGADEATRALFETVLADRA